MPGKVIFNGQTNNLTGNGSPNPNKLVIPGKDKMDPVMATAMLALEQWCNNLVAPPSSSGGTYKSLTGPGQTTTPGKLTQLGDFTVSDNQTGGATGIQLLTGSTSALPIFLSANDGIVGGNAASITLSGSGTGSVNIEAGSGSGANIAVSATGVTPGDIVLTSHGLGFYGAIAVAKATATGSRSANAALTSLLTILANLGLLTDSTTP